MAIYSVLPANQKYYVLDKQGKPAVGGKLVTTNTLTGAPLPTYQDIALTNANETTLTLGIDGSPETHVYCKLGDLEPLYTFTTYDAAGNLIDKIDDFPTNGTGGGGGTVIVVNDNTNLFINPQFNTWRLGTSFDNTTLPIGITPIADGWYYTRTSTGATVTITREEFDPGENEVPFSPAYYLQYTCSGSAPEGKNYIGQRFRSVQTLNNQQVTVSVYAKTIDVGTVSQITFYTIQNFGTGGSTAVETPFDVVDIDDTWQQYTTTFTVPDIAAKSIGVYGDDYIEFAYKIKTNQVIQVGIADTACQTGTGSGLDYPYISPQQQYAQLPNFTNGINIIEIGADNTGNTDVTPFFNAALKFLDFIPEKRLYFPEGRYLFSTRPNTIPTNLLMYGDGAAVSVLVRDYVEATPDNGFIELDTNESLHLEVRGISIVAADTTSGGTGVFFTSDTTTSSIAPTVSDVTITGEGTGTFAYGIALNGSNNDTGIVDALIDVSVDACTTQNVYLNTVKASAITCNTIQGGGSVNLITLTGTNTGARRCQNIQLTVPSSSPTIAFDYANNIVVNCTQATAVTNTIHSTNISFFGDATTKDRNSTTFQYIGQADFTNVQNANGYTRLPGGTIMQWGLYVVPDSGTMHTVTYRIPFPTAPYSIQITPYTGAGWAPNIATVITPGVTDFTMGTNTGQQTNQFFWFAVGH